MALSTAATGLTPQQWDAKFSTEYVREHIFFPVMGTSEANIIHVKEDLAKSPGDTLTYALVNKLTGNGVSGNTRLDGNEEEMKSRSHALTVEVVRNGVEVTNWDRQKSSIDLRNAARVQLKEWSMDKMRRDILQAMLSVNGTNYDTVSEANKDAWLVDNADRALFGAAVSNNSSNDHSASLANVDSTNDTLSRAIIRLARRRAKTASPIIRPYRIEGGREMYVLYVGSYAFRDLEDDLDTIHQNARERGVDNPIFTPGDIIVDNVIVKEVPEIDTELVTATTGLSTAGASSIAVAPCFLCGAQALGLGWAQRSKTATMEKDYGFANGVSVEEIRGIEKLTFGSGSTDTADLKDNGMLTLFVSGVADT